MVIFMQRFLFSHDGRRGSVEPFGPTLATGWVNML